MLPASSASASTPAYQADLVSSPPTADATNFETRTKPFVSADGRFVAYEGSWQTAEGNYYDQALYTDRATGQTSVVSHVSGDPSTWANDNVTVNGISADGRYVEFTTRASNLDAAAPSYAVPYIGDTITGVVTPVPRPAIDGANWVTPGNMSDDGRYVVMSIEVSNQPRHVVVVDRAAGTFEELPGLQTTDYVDQVSLSGDGRTVAFVEYDGAAHTNELRVFDLSTNSYRYSSTDAEAPVTLTDDGETIAFESGGGDRVNVVHLSGGGVQVAQGVSANEPVISSDGTTVAFSADNGDSNYSLYNFNLVGKSGLWWNFGQLVSMNSNGYAAESYNFDYATLTPDGRGAAFATNGYSNHCCNNGYQIRFAHAPDSSAPSWVSGSAVTAANVTGSSLILSWPAASDDAAVSGYAVSQDGHLLADVLTATSYQVTGLEPGSHHTFTVEARDLAGNTTDLPGLDVTTPSGNQAGTAPLAATAAPGGVATLRWDADASADSYRVLRATGDGSFATVADGVTATTWNDAGLLADTHYRYLVDTVSGGSATPYTSEAAIDTPAITVNGVQVTPDKIDGGAIDAKGQVSVRLDGEPNRRASAVLHWANAPDVTLPLAENTPGGYGAATSVPASATALTAVTATLTDGVDAHAVSADATGLPLPVSGMLTVTVNPPGAGDIAGATVKAYSPTRYAGAQATITGPGTVDLVVSPADDYGISLVLPDGRTIATATGISVPANGVGTATLQPVWPDASLTVHLPPPAGETAGGFTISVTNHYNYYKSVDLAAGQTAASFTGLSTGATYTVTAQLDDLKRPILQQQTQQITLGEGANDLTLNETALPKATLTGVVTAGGTPYAGANLKFSEYVDGRYWSYSATSAADGSYRADVLAGSVTVSTPSAPFGYTGTAEVVDAAAAQTTIADVELGTIAGSHVVHLRLYTQDFGGAETLQTLDWTTNIHFHTSLVDSDGQPLPINGNDLVVPTSASALTFCADGFEAGLPRECTTVDLDSYEVSLALHLAQQGGITATLVAPNGVPSSGRWNVVATPVDENGQAIGPDVKTSGDGSAVRFGVPMAGRYRLAFSADNGSYLTTVGVPDAGEADLGTIQLVARTPFSASGTSVIVVPTSLLPGQLAEVRVQYTAATTLAGAVLRLGVPYGADLIADGVTLNGQLVTGSMVDGFYEVPLGDLVAGDSGVVRYSLRVADDADAGPLSAPVRVRYNGSLDDPVGTATAQVAGVTLYAPYHVTSTSVTVRGQAPAGTQVLVTKSGAALGTATAGPGGLWSLTVDLGASLPGSTSSLVATTAYLGTTLTSNTVGVTYDPSWLQPTSITVSQPSGRSHTFDPSAGTAYFTLVYVPSEPVRVSAEFSDTSRLLQPTAWVGANSASMTCTATTCTADVPVTATTVGDVRVDYDVAPLVPASLQDLPPTPTIDEASSDLAGPFAGMTPTVTSSADGTSATVHGTATAVDGVSPIDFDSTVTATTTATPPAGEPVTIAQGVTMYITHSLAVDDDGNATFTEDLALPASAASQLAASSTASPALAPMRTALAQLQPADSLSDWIVLHVATAATGTRGAIGALLGTWQHIRVAPDKYYDGLSDVLAEIDNASCLTSTQKWLLKAEVETAGVQTTLIYTMQGATPWVFVALAPEIDAAVGVGGIAAGLTRAALSSAAGWTYGRWMQHILDDTKGDVEKVMRDKGCPEQLPPPGPPAARPTYIFDPSGYTYEALAWNRLAGVTATIETAPTADGPWTTWDAADFGQDNPQITDSQGRYGWDVPVGWYRVRFDKDGYFTAYSKVVQVLPEWTDLNVGLGRIAPATVTGVSISPEQISVSFDTWMKVDSVKANAVVEGPGRSPVPGEWVPLDAQTAPDGTVLATMFAYKPERGYHGNEVDVTIGAATQDYAGVQLGQVVYREFPLHGGQL